MLKKLMIGSLAVLTSLCCGAQSVPAALMSADLPELPGLDSFVTRDTRTGLDWLDIALTTSISFNAITGGTAISNGGPLNGLNPITGTDFAGNPFRHATTTEVTSLFQSAAIPAFDLPIPGWATANFAPVETLIALLGGVTGSPGTDFPFVQGSAADDAAAATEKLGPFIQLCINSTVDDDCSIGGGPFGLARALTSGSSIGVDFSDSFRGHWLVRSASADLLEPATLPLLGFGIGGLGLAVRRSRRHAVSSGR